MVLVGRTYCEHFPNEYRSNENLLAEKKLPLICNHAQGNSIYFFRKKRDKFLFERYKSGFIVGRGLAPAENYDTIFTLSVYKMKDYRQNYNINLAFVYGGSKPNVKNLRNVFSLKGSPSGRAPRSGERALGHKIKFFCKFA